MTQLSSSRPSADAGDLGGIFLMCAAVAMFALLDTSAKVLGQSASALFVVWCRYAVHFVIVGAVFWPTRRPDAWRSNRWPLQILRSLFLFGATALNFVSLNFLPLTETLTIFFTAPLVIALLGGPILGEWIGVRRWIAVIVGFFGILIVTQPGFDNFHWAMMLSFASAVSYSCYALSTRSLARTETASSMLVISAAAGVILLLPALPLIGQLPVSLGETMLYLCPGLFGAIGHWALIHAHQRAPAGVLAPYMYTQIIWAIALGFAVFGDLPSAATIIGACVIVASGLYIWHREHAERSVSKDV